MTQGPLEKAIRRRQELLSENSEYRAKVDRNTAEIAQIDAALAVMRKFAPLGQLPGLDEDVAAAYGDLASMTLPDACAAILYKRGEGLGSGELLDILVKAGRFKVRNNNAQISLIAALKRNPKRFRKEGPLWTLIEPGHQLRVLEGMDNTG